MSLAGLLFANARRGRAGLPKLRPYVCRTLKMTAACLLLSHAAAYSQGGGAPAATPSASAAVAPVTLPKTIPFKQDSALASGEGGPSFTAIALVVALGLAGFSLWVWRNRRQAGGTDNAAKRSGWWGGASSKEVLVHSTTRLSPRHSVYDIEWQGRRLLVGCSDQTMTLLSENAPAESSMNAAAQSHPVPASQEHKP